MLTIKASLAFKKSNISGKVSFGGNVTNALAADAVKSAPFFPDLPIPISKLIELTLNLAAADTDLINGGRTARQIAKAAELAWDSAYTITANYVTIVSDNNPVTISYSGYLTTKNFREKKPLPGLATNFKAGTNQIKGAIIAGSFTGVPAAKAHVVTALPVGVSIEYQENTIIITAGEQKIYLSAFTGKSIKLYGLASGKSYTVSMFSVNASGVGPATPVQEVIPQ